MSLIEQSVRDIFTAQKNSLQLIGDTISEVNSVPVLQAIILDGSGNQVTSFGGSGGGDATAANQSTMITSLQLMDDTVATFGSAIVGKGFQLAGSDGTNARALRVDTDGHVQVDVLSMPTVTVEQATSANLKAQVHGLTAHDGVYAQNPLGIGGYASATAPSNVSDGDIVRLWSDLAGRLQVGDGGESFTVDAPVATPVFVRLSDGTNAISTLPVSLASVPSHAVTNAGTFAVQVNGSALTALQLLDNVIGVVGSAVPGSGSAMGVSDGTNTRIARSDTDGHLQIDVLTMPALGAGSALIGQVRSSLETSTIYDGTTALTPKFAIIDAATSGDNTLVAAVTGKKIRVHAAWGIAAGTVNARFESGASGTALSGQANLVANTGFVLPFSQAGWFETASGALLNLELSAAISVDGGIVYTEV